MNAGFSNSSIPRATKKTLCLCGLFVHLLPKAYLPAVDMLQVVKSDQAILMQILDDEKHIPYLPAVEAQASHSLLFELLDYPLFDLVWSMNQIQFLRLFEPQVPDFRFQLSVHNAEIDRVVDPRQNYYIKRRDSIRSQYENSFEVLDFSQEDCPC